MAIEMAGSSERLISTYSLSQCPVITLSSPGQSIQAVKMISSTALHF